MAIVKEIGHINSFYQGVGKVTGLPNVFLNEVLIWENKEKAGIVIGYDQEFAEVLFFKPKEVDYSKPLFRTKTAFKIPVGESYLGRVVNGIGEPIDNLGKISGKQESVFRPAPPIIDRQPVSVPLSTGIKMIDTMLPLGRGQRELVIGDRKLGKSTIALDVVLNQKEARPPVYCVYVICGQKERQLQEIISLFKEHQTFSYTTIVAATASDSFAQQYLAPFIGCRIGEYFRDNGKDALVIYDDLSKHAKVYRDVSLLFKRAPGRETYPGDIFSLHAHLLERAAKLSDKKGGGSLSAIPIVETLEGDIASFIPTNIISITDGQIYLERGLYQKGFLPAINIGLSVSRVGSQAQPPLLKEATKGIRLALAQHKELQKLTQLETVVSKESRKRIERGELILELLKQDKHDNIRWEEQVILFYLTQEGLFDDVEKQKWVSSEKLLLDLIRTRYNYFLQSIRQGDFDEKTKEKIKSIAADFKNEFFQK